MSDGNFEVFSRHCRELGLPEDCLMGDFMEFLEAFTTQIRERTTNRVRRDLQWRHDNPSGSGPRGPAPDSPEGNLLIESEVRADLCVAGIKLAQLLEGLK